MVVRLGRSGGIGRSFLGAWRYYGHDKNAQTSDRVGAVFMVGLKAENGQDAVGEMVHTVRQAPALKRKSGISPRGRKAKKPVAHWSLSWAPGEKPTHAQMREAAVKSIAAAGYEGHQSFLVIHTDEPHPHIHIILNRIHPVTGVTVKSPFLRLKFSRWAESYERTQGKIRCRQRVINNRKRDAGEFVKYTSPVIAKAWERARNGRGFAAILRRSGHILARGDRRGFVIVDQYGDVHNPTRQIEGVRAADIRAKLSDLDPASLPSVAEATEQAAQWQRQQEAREERRKKQQRRRNWQERYKVRRKRKPAPVIRKPRQDTAPVLSSLPLAVPKGSLVPCWQDNTLGAAAKFPKGSLRSCSNSCATGENPPHPFNLAPAERRSHYPQSFGAPGPPGP